MSKTVEAVRVDKWLWAARFFKTRTLASDAVDNGKVKLNDERIKPARNLKAGEILTIDNGANVWEVEVLLLADTRGSAAIAQTLYRETEQSMAKRSVIAEDRKFFKEPTMAIKGRPTKRDRRLLDKAQS
ncbi:Ribosome-associated heat shock protein implicated in the recycling of the 50S subunit [Collimonas arenae]|uniref:Ribosome-associated heat shock protein implicated in the recycling of the 50S subunit n=1 Tax=Collimonas arenae TaxID=279058 RepID=A0A0A1F4Z0_9BURK|nr:RNA-binding S4 domain-containing protein [Collimonas arenae]AIY39748.1 Ribosome-associated heat shock protein implicated in the recycling of the 50S subunit [Collimonas arenae]